MSGDYRQTAILFPGQTVRVLHDGAVRFRGWVADGQLSADPTESQEWRCYDAHWNSRLVTLLRSDKVGSYYYNVTDTESDEYDSTQAGKTLGEILKHQFQENADLLRFYGCAPPTGDAFVQTELDLLDAEIPDVVASGQFPVMVDTLLRFMGHKFVVWVDPEDLVWHFRDVTTLTGEDVAFTSEWVTFKVKPDRDKAYTRVEWRGTRKADADPVVLKLSRRVLEARVDEGAGGQVREVEAQQEPGRREDPRRRRGRGAGRDPAPVLRRRRRALRPGRLPRRDRRERRRLPPDRGHALEHAVLALAAVLGWRHAARARDRLQPEPARRERAFPALGPGRRAGLLLLGAHLHLRLPRRRLGPEARQPLAARLLRERRRAHDRARTGSSTPRSTSTPSMSRTSSSGTPATATRRSGSPRSPSPASGS